MSLTASSESPTSLSLQWLPPPEDGRNGIIILYSVNITRVSTGDSIEFTDIRDPYLTVESLRPYTQYSCSVAAYTAIGMGPYSIPILALTDEDGMNLIVMNMINCFLMLNFFFSIQPQVHLQGILE